MRVLRLAFRLPIRFIRTHKLLTFLALTAGLSAMLMRFRLETFADWALIAASGGTAIYLITRIWNDVRAGTYGTDLLTVVAVISALLLQQFWLGLAAVAAWALTLAIVNRILGLSRRELNALRALRPHAAHIIRKNKALEVSVNDIQEGDTLRVETDELVAADARIVAGSGRFDEAALTGAAGAQQHTINEIILAGSRLTEGSVRAVVIRPSTESQYLQTMRLLESAPEHPAPFAVWADRYTIPYTVGILAIAGLGWIVSHDPNRFLAVLLTATLVALTTAAPGALIFGISRLAKLGVIVKTGTALQQLAFAKAVVLARSGVLSIAAPTISDVIAFPPFRKSDVITTLASIEQARRGSLAQALMAFDRKLKLAKVSHLYELAGSGAGARIQGRDAAIGTVAVLVAHGVTLPQRFKPPKNDAYYLAISGQLAGYITYETPLQARTKSVLHMLQRFGVRRIVIATNQAPANAAAFAKQTGASEVQVVDSPGATVNMVEAIDDHPAAFVAATIDDAPALMAADVGIAFAARGNVEIGASADVLTMDNELGTLADAFAAAKYAFRIATVILIGGLTLSVAALVLAALGIVPAVLGIIIQLLLNIATTAYSLRARQLPKLNLAD